MTNLLTGCQKTGIAKSANKNFIKNNNKIHKDIRMHRDVYLNTYYMIINFDWQFMFKNSQEEAKFTK
jgi:hypothetical protein